MDREVILFWLLLAEALEAVAIVTSGAGNARIVLFDRI